MAERVEQDGIEAWFSLDPAELLGAEAEQYDKVTDVMDVWADSGLSFECVGAERPEIAAPVDLYLEGSDQHRGWFHSSLLMSEALYERAPYRGVLTHGFTVDEKGRKQSKSLGNVVAPQKVMNSLGADVLRLWVSATDYANEMSVSDEILKRMADSYRRMRNTRALPARQPAWLRSEARCGAAGRDAGARSLGAGAHRARCRRRSSRPTASYAFHLIYQKVHNFCIVDLGGLLSRCDQGPACTPRRTTGRARRSAQTAMYHIAESMVRWLAPILSFTAEEIWAFPARRARRVGVSRDLASGAGESAATTIDWPALHRSCAAMCMRELEKLRDAGAIGAPLDAEVDVYCAPGGVRALQRAGRGAAFPLHHLATRGCTRSTDAARRRGARHQHRARGVWIAVKPIADPKCVRCWHRRPDVGSHAEHPELCGRCVTNIEGPGEQRKVRMNAADQQDDRQRRRSPGTAAVARAEAAGAGCRSPWR